MKVRQVMSVNPVTVHPDTTVRTALGLLAAHAITTLPVIDAGGRIVGVVGEGDLIGANGPHAVVDRVMSRAPVVVYPETGLDEVGSVLKSARIRSIPVVDTADQVVGMVSRSDVVRALARDDGMLAQDIVDAMCAAGLSGWQVTVHNGIVDLLAPADGLSDSAVASRAAERVLGVDAVWIR